MRNTYLRAHTLSPSLSHQSTKDSLGPTLVMQVTQKFWRWQFQMKKTSVWSVCKNPQQKSDMSYSSSKKAYQRRQGEMTIRLRWFHAPAISNCRFNKMNFLWLLYETGITYSTVDKNHCSQYFCSLNLYTVRQPSIQIQEMSHSLFF